jgi:dipeptidyl aminopeptidase/acylaminoacyl peptidase
MIYRIEDRIETAKESEVRMTRNRLFTIHWLLFVVMLSVLVSMAAAAAERPGEAPRAMTAEDYARAEKFMPYNAAPLVLRTSVRPNWLPGDRFWYRNALEKDGSEFILVDPKKKSRGPAFDHARIGAALSKAAGKSFDAARLPFTSFEFSADGKSITFSAEGKRWSCDLKGKECQRLEDGEPAPPEKRRGEGFRPGGAPLEVLSPNGQFAVFIKDHNLWLRDVATKAEKPLTTDGIKDYGYATDNAGWIRSDRPVVVWSPDSTKVATFQQDQREVGEMYLVETKVGHPVLQAWKYPLPGDKVVSMIERVIIHLDGPRLVRLKMPPDQHRSTFTDDIKTFDGGMEDVQWSPDGKRLVFVSTSRDHKHEIVREVDPETGEVRDIFEEKAETYFESGSDHANWRFLAASNEIIWYSERSNWAHFYLYDIETGRLKNQVTTGDWPVLQLLRVDEKSRRITFLAGGREEGRDPYFRHLYSIGLDGGGIRLLTPEDADHEVSLSPSGLYFIDTHSKPDSPQVSVLRTAEGKPVLSLEKADISRLQAAGWKPPIPITVKARDGQADLYGLMFRPTDFDPARKYPIINNIYPGPQSGSVMSRSFLPAHGDAQALAELGFIVVQIDGMGNPGRSKAFHDAYYGNMGDNTLPDQVAGMKELAQRYPWIDIDRAGIWGHSGGGFATCDAMFRYPDFFKVGVSQAGNHDNRGYEDDWGEKWQGLLVTNPDGTSNYDSQANQNFAKNLKGKLLLAHGTMDGNVPPYLTLLVVNELIKANKDFDLIMFPNRGHGFANEPYMVRRRWDYFVRHLLGAEPPAGYELKPPARPGRPTM